MRQKTEKDRLNILVEHSGLDRGEIDGATLILMKGTYLLELAQTLPPNACIDEHWTGYEDMEMRNGT